MELLSFSREILFIFDAIIYYRLYWVKTMPTPKTKTRILWIVAILLCLAAGILIPILLQAGRGVAPGEEGYQGFEQPPTEVGEPEEPVAWDEVLAGDSEPGVETPDPEEVETPGTPGLDWIDQRIAAVEAEVQPEDLADFKAIIGKLDVDYINRLVDEGLDEVREAELRGYLHSRLTDGEYTRAKELFLDYNALLFE